MYQEHELFSLPADDKTLWRYIDFSKFLRLISSSTLYFCPLSKFSDYFEGRIPDVTIKYWEEKISEGYTLQNGATLSLDDLKNHLNLFENLRPGTLVNSWHMNDYESAAMWKMYAKNEYGLAIISSTERLKYSFTDPTNNVFIGEVKYYSPDKPYLDLSNTFFPTLNKLISYQSENELRAVIQKTKEGTYFEPEYPNGLEVKVNLENLISEIKVSPNAPSELTDVIKLYLDKYSLGDKTVSKSSLKDTYLK